MTKESLPSKKKPSKRPTDVNQLAHFLGEQSTKEPAPHEAEDMTEDEIKRLMSMLGRRGGKIGGKRRAELMTPEQRHESASKAARARWGKN